MFYIFLEYIFFFVLRSTHSLQWVLQSYRLGQNPSCQSLEQGLFPASWCSLQFFLPLQQPVAQPALPAAKLFWGKFQTLLQICRLTVGLNNVLSNSQMCPRAVLDFWGDCLWAQVCSSLWSRIIGTNSPKEDKMNNTFSTISLLTFRVQHCISVQKGPGHRCADSWSMQISPTARGILPL